jgi:penicillin-binding protein 1A
VNEDWADALGAIEAPLGIDAWQLAAVLELQEEGAVIGFQGGALGYIPMQEITWARQWREGETLGPKIKDVAEVLALGDVIPVEWLGGPAEIELPTFVDQAGQPLGPAASFTLRQIPDVEGAIVAMDPHTGRVLAMVGGYDFRTSEFNRATQAERQPGSAFKPFVYASALEQGFTPSSLVLDAPFVMDQGEGQGKWKPGNSGNKFYGPSTLRLGLVRSRNLMTVRLAQYIGMDSIIDYADRFGIGDNLRPTLAMSLGAGEVSLLKLTAAYAMLVNGGNWIDPGLIDRIQDRRGKTIYRLDERPCGGCNRSDEEAGPEGLLISDANAAQDVQPIPPEPVIPDQRKRVLDERTAYQVVSMLQGVVKSGPGRRIGTLGWPLGGKTGTTNDWIDAWFVGFSPDLAVGVFVGFDRPRSLGKREEGSLAAAPIFRDFMAAALKGQPHIPFRIPPGIRLVRVNPTTGLPAGEGSGRVILEAFIPGTEPSGDMLLVLDGANGFMQTDGKLRKGTGGLY